MDTMVRVRFRLRPDEDGWPPAESEGLWAETLPPDPSSPGDRPRYRIDNTPWFVTGISADDIVTAEPDGDGVLWATGVVASSGRLTIRVIALADGALHGDPVAVARAFEHFGIGREIMEAPVHMTALDLGPGNDLPGIKELLRLGEAQGWWAYEEGNVTTEWTWL